MSAEYFDGDILNEDDKNLEEISRNQDQIGDWSYSISGPATDAQDGKLHEMGEALEVAENRCNSLKQQLDQMKSMYRQKNNILVDSTTKIKPRAAKEQFKEYGRIPQVLGRNKNLIRQNSDCITTDNTGAAVVTINNILNGITNSINRLSELQTTIDVDKEPIKIATRKSKTLQEKGTASEEFQPVSSECICLINTNCSKRKESRRRLKQTSATSMESSSSLRRNRKRKESRARREAKDEPEKEETLPSIKRHKKRIKRLKQWSRTTLSNVKSTKPDIRGGTKPLVEIYHNAAVKSSGESDENIEQESSLNSKRANVELKSKSKKNEATPKLNPEYCRQDNRALSPIEEQVDGFDALNSERYNPFTHNYEAPTIASRMKQVAKGYFRSINAKTIPFCAAKSTTPSHNIGINIQQVMNIIKNRQPIKGISPTLAHNIGIAAEKLNHRSLSAMVSTLGSRMGYNYMPCPMIRNSINYQRLQEMAKDIPEEIEEEVEEKGDGDCSMPQETVWAIDPKNQSHCTCIPRTGIGFQQVLNKFQSYTPEGSNQNQETWSCELQMCVPAMQYPSQIVGSKFTTYQSSIMNNQNNQYSQRIMKKSNEKYKHIKSVYAQCNENKRKSGDYSVQEYEMENGGTNMPLKGKEKILKGVLLNLHDEFRQLSEKYDELSTQIEGNDNEETTNELAKLEKKLNDKELEIQMVMSLYTEVVQLKQQLKALREKTSLVSLMVEQQRQQYQNVKYRQYCPIKFRKAEIKEPSAAVHLTKLLRQIQTYQEVHKTGGK